jgi:hypothetical protein
LILKKSMVKVVNHKGVELQVGDRIKIISDHLGKKALANVELGEELIITGISEDGKIIYHHNTLALPTNSDVYTKLL